MRVGRWALLIGCGMIIAAVRAQAQMPGTPAQTPSTNAQMPGTGGAGANSQLPGTGAGAAAPAAPAQPAGGYFTIAQAQDGATVYGAKCASCHGETMDGYIGPPLHGNAFQVIATRLANVYRLFITVAADEPEDSPGSLSNDDYANVVAYILQGNGYPSGRTKLLPYSPQLKNLSLLKPEAPKGGALVQPLNQPQ